jgi:hypothetical protein
MLLVCAAGPLDTGQDNILTYLFFLFLNFLPTFIVILFHLAYPTKTLAKAIVKTAPWRLRGNPRAICRTRIKRYKIPVRDNQVKPVEPKAYELTFFRRSSLPTRLVVALRCFSDASPVCPPGTWPSKVRRRSNLRPHRSDSTLTPILSGSIATHRDAWPTNPTCLKTCASTRTGDKSMG